MSETIIQVENLGKKYIIGHQKQERYATLRDQMANGAKSLGQSLLKPFGKQSNDPSSEEFWALKDLSFEIKEGDRVGVIGHNGAGKSTLLKILSRITEPTTGRITIKGRVASLLEVGTGFHQELTGRENIFLNGAILGMSKAEIKQKFDEIVAFSEVDKYLDTPVKKYSSGMRVRLAFAVAAHLEPEILIVDEVLAVGDIAFQNKCIGKMEDITENQGRTVLFVSHQMAAVRKLCNVAYWLEKGKIRETGAVDHIIDSYEKHMISRASSQLNGKIVNEEHGLEIHSIDAFVEDDEDTLTLKIEIKGCAQQQISRLGISIQITTSDGILVSNIWPRMANSFLDNIQGDWNCVFEYQDITKYLGGGDYIINIIVTRLGKGIIFKLEDAAIINIPPVDIYDSGNYFSWRQHGFVPLPVQFSYSCK
ncbi:ABC transporter ATP-binding protein [Lyngbya sp. PCC 8106]|uniref:ABC transporter ATP-binding protein n=1 Tax=Lyngbya sp. (strain PCC 8106) TaxID=313612 RepID=UPI0000EAC6D3|nr:ABC transporter ATP-binding protein [Lyngbya sp. PCC 8106]EAW38814.1 ABC transporter [Lyngbya sp. PCC 8106]